MKRSHLIKSLALTALITLPNIAYAETFWVSGTIVRSLIDSTQYGKCMVQLSTPIGNNCPNVWISLDCEGKYLASGDGDRMLNLGLLAQNLNKSVSIQVDNTKLADGYCTANRIDLIQ